MSQYFPKPYEPFGGINVKADLSKYAIKSDLQNVSHMDVTRMFALKSSLASLRAHRQISKNGVSKSIALVIKQAHFQLCRVHPEGVI